MHEETGWFYVRDIKIGEWDLLEINICGFKNLVIFHYLSPHYCWYEWPAVYPVTSLRRPWYSIPKAAESSDRQLPFFHKFVFSSNPLPFQDLNLFIIEEHTTSMTSTMGTFQTSGIKNRRLEFSCTVFGSTARQSEPLKLRLSLGKVWSLSGFF